MYFLGIDVGTQGARTLVCDDEGNIHARADRSFPLSPDAGGRDGRHEQNPSDWWSAAAETLRDCGQTCRDKNISPSSIRGISVTSTSGTVCMINENGEPLGPALMYNDGRSASEAVEGGNCCNLWTAPSGWS